jgi:hypothetical protein
MLFFDFSIDQVLQERHLEGDSNHEQSLSVGGKTLA